jgi:hypothetical protein
MELLLVRGSFPNSNSIWDSDDQYLLSGKSHDFEWPNCAIKPTLNGQGDVIGGGLLLNAEKKMSIFFTTNGILMGKSK